MKHIPTIKLTIAALGFIIVIILIVGCQSTPRTIDERIPDSNDLHELLYIGDTFAYKSVTHDDYIIKENC